MVVVATNANHNYNYIYIYIAELIDVVVVVVRFPTRALTPTELHPFRAQYDAILLLLLLSSSSLLLSLLLLLYGANTTDNWRPIKTKQKNALYTLIHGNDTYREWRAGRGRLTGEENDKR